ncbi:MAG: hypothetical protein JWM63_2075 [Gammaproteobacteria bacterium]|nr:hypothetical protein [Gammaproteobacteria bacterium]
MQTLSMQRSRGGAGDCGRDPIRRWPGIEAPTDGRLEGVRTGGWGDPEGKGAHGLNERRSIRSVFVGRDFLTDLIKVYADAN